MSDDADEQAEPPRSAAPADETYDAGLEAQTLLRTVRSGALATLTPDGDPYASLVSLASLPDGSPVLPLSTLAVHTQHLLADPRCSLLLDGGGKGDPLTHPRVTLVGRAVQATSDERAAWRTRFLRRHPKAALYVDFGDFAFWRVELRAARVIGGFGRIHSLSAAEILTSTVGAEALVEGETRSLDHMNDDHADAIRLYATVLAGGPEGGWRISGIDPDGLDLTLGDDTRRLRFPQRIEDPAALRRQLVVWAEAAKAVTP